MKSNRSYNNNNSKSDGNRPPSTRSYSSVASQPHNNPPPPSLAPPAPVPAPAAAAAPVRSSPSTVTEGALNQIHAYVRGLNKSDQDTHRLTFMHLIQSMIGKEVQVDLKDGSIVTGVLHTTTFPLRRQVEEGEYFSGDFPKQVLLKAAKLKQSGSSGRSFEAGAALFIDYADVISLVANIGDLHHRAVSADFRTDSSIKKQDLSFLQGRELQGVSDAWLDPTKATDLAPQTGKQWDQFETNRVLFNVNSTYDENIYTKKLDKSSFTAEQVARAERLAREIEKQQSGNIHLLEERGLLTEREIDEEAMYSGVIRHDYQPEVPLVSSSSHGNTPTNRSNGHSNSGSSKSNRAAQPDTPWQRGLKLNDSGKRAPVPSVEPVQQAPAISNPPPLAPAPGLIDRNNVPSPSTQQQRDRVSPVRFGAFHDQQPPSATVKTSTPTLESGFSKVSLDEANQKPLPALTPNPAVAAAVANVSNNESISRSASGPVGGLPTSTSNHSLQDSAKTTPVKESEEKTASSKLNPSAKAFVPNINAKVFTPSVPVPVPVPVPVVDVPPPVPVYTAPVVPVAPPPAPVPVPVQVPVQVPVTPVTKTVPPPVVPHVTPTAPVQPHVPYVQPPTPPVVHNNYPISASVSHDSPAAQRLNPSIKNSPSVAPMMNPAVTSSPSTMSIPPPANVPNMSVPTPVYNMMYTPEQLLAMQQQAYYDPTLAYYQQQQQQQQQQHYFYQQQQYLAMMQQQQQYVMSNPGMVAQQPYVAAGMPQQQQQQQQQHMYYSNGQVTNQPMPGANYAFGYDQNGMQYQQTGFQQQPSYYPNAATHQQPLQRSNSGYSQGSKGPRKNMNNVSGGGGRRYNGGGGGGYSQHSNSPQTHDRHDNDHQMNDNSPNDVYSPESS